MNIVLRCAECGCDINVASCAGLESKTAECPHCHQKFKMSEFLPKMSLKVGSRNYQLHFGRQWVGRLTEGNDAEVQIEDETRYMSRKHAIIELKCTPTGIACTFEEHGKNPTSIQGVDLITDDIVYLNINDCLKLGSQKMYLADEFED